MGDGAWPKMGSRNHGGSRETVDWIVAHWSLVDAYARLVM